jgi:hypothetical protein
MTWYPLKAEKDVLRLNLGDCLEDSVDNSLSQWDLDALNYLQC